MKPSIQQPAAGAGGAVVPLADPSATKGLQAAVVTAPVLRAEAHPAFEWSTTLRANEGAGSNARLRARPWLKISRWPGNVDIATRVADMLVDNAVRHGRPFADGCVALHLIVTRDTHELLVEVDDAYADFPDFERVTNPSGEPVAEPTSPSRLSHYQGRLSWGVRKNVDGEPVGKTVQVVITVG
ncbi:MULTISPECIES: hypothetical protein [unclassified Streptomyces]|uniref:hypothetical protein n=1 Tax=unclassified Streptomyces TaxID=2593676 RepID=UPI003715D8EE